MADEHLIANIGWLYARAMGDGSHVIESMLETGIPI